VKDRGLLKPRMKITAYNQHDVGSFVEPWPFATTNLLPNRANVVMQSRAAELPVLKGNSAESRNLLFAFSDLIRASLNLAARPLRFRPTREY
ncbi:MAG TPA: hypothetical protein VI386_10985, partial [Candidatus Sulfotelmatobacter sp.]